MPKPLSIRAQIYLILIPALLYLGLFLARPLWIHPWCAVNPSPCTPGTVNGFDQISLHYNSMTADFISNLLQNSIGVFAFIFPWLFLRGDAQRSIRLNLTLLMATAWNGAFVELVRALVQRPRPLVFNSPLGDGANINQYTSFYSGHTSFVALALCSTLMFSMTYAKERTKSAFFLLFAFVSLSLLTGALRVMGGRHFPSDTLAGFLFGTVIAYSISKFVMRRIK
jgi:hypothetical protein